MKYFFACPTEHSVQPMADVIPRQWCASDLTSTHCCWRSIQERLSVDRRAKAHPKFQSCRPNSGGLGSGRPNLHKASWLLEKLVMKHKTHFHPLTNPKIGNQTPYRRLCHELRRWIT